MQGLLGDGDIDLLYVTPLRAVDLKFITSCSRSRRIVTMTGVPTYVEMGLAVGIGTKGEKPRILVNLKAAIAEGADYQSQLLKLVKIIE